MLILPSTRGVLGAVVSPPPVLTSIGTATNFMSSSGSSMAVSWPDALQVGDVVLIALSFTSPGGSVTVSASGWTISGNIGWYRSNGSESGNALFAITSGSVGFAQMFAYRGCTSGTPLEGADNRVTTDTTTASSVTTSFANETVVNWGVTRSGADGYGSSDASYTHPGFTLRNSISYPTVGGGSVSYFSDWFDIVVPVAGTQNGISGAVLNVGIDSCNIASFALIPPQ
jgi:hypothetical protein